LSFPSERSSSSSSSEEEEDQHIPISLGEQEEDEIEENIRSSEVNESLEVIDVRHRNSAKSNDLKLRK
jgi:hypothetical protein